MNKDKMDSIGTIVKRAEKMGIMMFDGVSLMMDLKLADNFFEMDFDKMIESDDFNFSHDVIGIQKNINRTDKTFENFFLPRFSKPKN